MTAYTSTVTFDQANGAEKISKNLGILTGTIDVTNYNTTGAEITDITTKYFQECHRVILDPMTDNGYFIRWDVTDKCVHAYRSPTWVVPHDATQYTEAGPKLTYVADPTGTNNATPLYFVEGEAYDPYNMGTIQCTCEHNANADAETDNTACFGGTPSMRIPVSDSNSPSGVKIYVKAGTGILQCVSPTGRDGCFLMYTESSAAVPTHIWACAVTVHHNASVVADGGVELEFHDDNATPDAALQFVDAATTDRVIPAADITPLGSLFGLTSDFDNSTIEVCSDVDIGLTSFVAYGRI